MRRASHKAGEGCPEDIHAVCPDGSHKKTRQRLPGVVRDDAKREDIVYIQIILVNNEE